MHEYSDNKEIDMAAARLAIADNNIGKLHAMLNEIVNGNDEMGPEDKEVATELIEGIIRFKQTREPLTH